MFTIADIGSKRLEKVLVKDKTEDPKKLAEILKSDLLNLLQNYMEVKDLNVDFEVDTVGYFLTVNAEAKRIKTFGIFPNWYWQIYFLYYNI